MAGASFDQEQTADEGFGGAEPGEDELVVFEGEGVTVRQLLRFAEEAEAFAQKFTYVTPEVDRRVAVIGWETGLGDLRASMRQRASRSD